jgi:DNA polymerase-1
MTPVHQKKLFLLDAFALIYRAYFAFAKNPRINSKGQNTSAAFGFTNSLIEVIKKEKPTHIAVVFDSSEPTNRAEEHEFYKAHREEMPEDIRSMIEPIKRIITAMNIPIIELSGYEADDIIGTLAKKAEQHGFYTYMMTPDKDFGQLVSEKIKIYKPARGGEGPQILGVEEVCEKFAVDDPIKVIDILGLWGDAVDNIPGIPGIGEKRAKELIATYGSIENLFEHTHELKGKIRENIINFREQGLISKKLATIITDLPIEINEEDLAYIPPNEEQLMKVFGELEFRNLAKRLLGEDIQLESKVVQSEKSQLDLFVTPQDFDKTEMLREAPSAASTISTENKIYMLVQNATDRKQLLELIMQQKSVCFDTETNSLEAREAMLIGIAFSWSKHEAFYLSIPKDFVEARAIVQEFLPFFSSDHVEKVAHNLKFDAQVLDKYGIQIGGPIFDTMIAHYLIQPEEKHNLDYLSELYLGYKPISIESLIGKKGKSQGNMADLSPEEVKDYACEDADITMQLKELFEPEMQKEHLKTLFYDLEMPLVLVLKDMELEGIRIDVQGLKRYSAELESEIRETQAKIMEFAGTDFNIDSPKQLGEILFEKLKIAINPKKTKTGQYATSEEVLAKYINRHPIVPLILEYRELRKLKSTYVDALPLLATKNEHRIHTHFMQSVTATGRLSSTNPNLQNIPIKTEKGRAIRKSFIARNEDYVLLGADYSQIELRIMAFLSKDPNMIKAFQDGEDIHAATASRVFSTPPDAVTKEQRSKAKAVNFGIIYGQSAFGLAENLNISRTEAKEIIDNYFMQYPKVREYMDAAIARARELGYVETIMKRRRYLPDINSANAVVRGFAERNAINAPIQGSAADIIKLAMIRVHHKIKSQGLMSKLILQVHDELVFDVPLNELETMKILVREEMQNAFHIGVPLIVEINAGRNWLEAH